MSGPEFFRKSFFKVDGKKIKEVIPLLPIMLPYYSTWLDRLKELAAINPNFIAGMTTERKARLNNQLNYTRSLLKAQLAIGYNEKVLSMLSVCEAIIDNKVEILLNKAPKEEWTLGYLQKKITEFFTHFPQISSNLAEASINDINSLNYHRLYWVWGGCLISSLFNLFEAGSLSSLRYNQSVYGYGASFVSFYYYFARFLFEFYLLIRSVWGPWTEDEKVLALDTTWIERLQLNWGKRKFQLINDSVWSVANCLCALVFIGNETLSISNILTFGDIGNYMTILLLVLDLTVAFMAYKEGSKAYKEAMVVLLLDLQKLEEMKEKLRHGIVNRKDENYFKLRQLRADIKEQKKLIQNTKLDWKYKKYSLEINLAYSILLFLSFVILCSVFCPAATVPLFFVNTFFIVGSLFAFGMNVCSEMLQRYLAIEKLKEELHYLDKECEYLLDEFNWLWNKSKKNIACSQDLPYLYLELAVLTAQKKNKEKTMWYNQAMEIVKSVAQALLPSLLLIAFTTLSAGAALGLVLGVMGALFLCCLTIKYLKPHWVSEKIENPQLAVYQMKEPLKLADFSHKNTNGFFKAAAEDFTAIVESVLPRWLLFVFPPLTLSLLLCGLIYSLRKSYQASANSVNNIHMEDLNYPFEMEVEMEANLPEQPYLKVGA